MARLSFVLDYLHNMGIAQRRREQELWLLLHEGVPLRTLGKCGHWKLGFLHIYTGAGRWFNQLTGERGRLKNLGMREVLEIRYCARSEESAMETERLPGTINRLWKTSLEEYDW